MVKWYATTEAEYQELIKRRDWYYALQRNEEWQHSVRVEVVRQYPVYKEYVKR